ncbi:MAG: DMT family transporter [Desulfobacterales bacterium]
MAYIFLILSTLFWSGNFVLSRGIAEIIPPVALGYFRWITAFLILLPFTYRLLKKEKQLIIKHIRYLLALAFLGVATFNTLIYKAMHFTTAINAVLVTSFIPVLILIISLIIYKEKPTGIQLVGILVSIFGIAMIILKADINRLMQLSLNTGDLLVLLAALSWAAYSVMLRSFPKELHPLVFLQSIIFLGLAILTPLYLMEYHFKGAFPVSLETIASILYVGFFASVLAFIFWNRAVRDIGAINAGPFVHLMPVFGTIFAIVFLGERVAYFHLFGITFVFIGIFITTKKFSK